MQKASLRQKARYGFDNIKFLTRQQILKRVMVFL